jgi:hypothetical protein
LDVVRCLMSVARRLFQCSNVVFLWVLWERNAPRVTCYNSGTTNLVPLIIPPGMLLGLPPRLKASYLLRPYGHTQGRNKYRGWPGRCRATRTEQLSNGPSHVSNLITFPRRQSCAWAPSRRWRTGGCCGHRRSRARRQCRTRRAAGSRDRATHVRLSGEVGGRGSAAGGAGGLQESTVVEKTRGCGERLLIHVWTRQTSRLRSARCLPRARQSRRGARARTKCVFGFSVRLGCLPASRRAAVGERRRRWRVSPSCASLSRRTAQCRRSRVRRAAEGQTAAGRRSARRTTRAGCGWGIGGSVHARTDPAPSSRRLRPRGLVRRLTSRASERMRRLRAPFTTVSAVQSRPPVEHLRRRECACELARERRRESARRRRRP